MSNTTLGNAPRVTQFDINANIREIEYVKHVTPAGKVLRFCVITCANGFAVTGDPSCAVSPENDNEEVGQQIAYQNAVGKMWALMGYALAEKLHNESRGDENQYQAEQLAALGAMRNELMTLLDVEDPADIVTAVAQLTAQREGV